MSLSQEGCKRFSQAASPQSKDIYLQPRRLLKVQKLLNSHFLSQPHSQGEPIQHGNSKDFVRVNDTGTEIMTSTGNILATLAGKGKIHKTKQKSYHC